MRKLIVVIFLFCSVVLPELGWAESVQKQIETKKLPAQILTYYNDCNYISLFSRKSEQGFLVQYLPELKNPDKVISKRLVVSRIFRTFSF